MLQVFSDEFNEDGRTFHDGQDPRWTAINKNDCTCLHLRPSLDAVASTSLILRSVLFSCLAFSTDTNKALHFYSHDNARTTRGVLNITAEQKVNSYRAFNEKTKKFYADKKHVQSAMLQSWNKFCFVGGIIEFSAKLPGHHDKGGLWPARMYLFVYCCCLSSFFSCGLTHEFGTSASESVVWMLGNLARATYVGSSDFMWPYSFNKCDSRNRRSQEINACARVNHYGLEPFSGRGAPEIDVLESMQGEPGKLPNTFIQRPYQSASFQVAPGIEIDRPVLGHKPHEVRMVLLYLRVSFRARYALLTIFLHATGTLVRKSNLFSEKSV